MTQSLANLSEEYHDQNHMSLDTCFMTSNADIRQSPQARADLRGRLLAMTDWTGLECVSLPALRIRPTRPVSIPSKTDNFLIKLDDVKANKSWRPVPYKPLKQTNAMPDLSNSENDSVLSLSSTEDAPGYPSDVCERSVVETLDVKRDAADTCWENALLTGSKTPVSEHSAQLSDIDPFKLNQLLGYDSKFKTKHLEHDKPSELQKHMICKNEDICSLARHRGSLTSSDSSSAIAPMFGQDITHENTMAYKKISPPLDFHKVQPMTTTYSMSGCKRQSDVDAYLPPQKRRTSLYVNDGRGSEVVDELQDDISPDSSVSQV